MERGPLDGVYADRDGSSWGDGRKLAISYDDRTDTYTFFETSLSSTPLTFTERDAIQGAVRGYNYFRPKGVGVGASDVIAVYNNDSRALIAFTYTSFAFARLPGASPSAPLQAYVFGIPTTSLPRTGLATYNGLLGGFATGSNGALYTLDGTSTLNANFGTGQYSTSMSFVGRNADGSVGLGKQTYNGNASFTSNGSPLNGELSGSGTGAWHGQFFGPNANEFGYAFTVRGSGYDAVGVAAGGKN